jgi:hypothetical protein
VSRLRRALAEHGWLVVDGPDDAASTVGLTAAGLAELVVVGLPPATGAALLHALATRLLDGERVADGEPVPGLLDGPGGADPVLVTVDRPLPAPATEVYGEAVVLRQLVWPDADGRLPWHPGFAHADLQPLLGPPPPPPHPHLTAAGGALPAWPLPDDPHASVLTARAVAAGAPALLVVCTDDGGLRFLDGVSDFDPEAAVVECLHDALERDLGLVEAVAAVRPGRVAERDGAGAAWTVS